MIEKTGQVIEEKVEKGNSHTQSRLETSESISPVFKRVCEVVLPRQEIDLFYQLPYLYCLDATFHKKLLIISIISDILFYLI